MRASRTLLCALVVTGFVAVVTPALAFAAHGAIAYNFHTGAVGRSWGYGSERQANTEALAECRQHPRGHGGRCYVVLTTEGILCGATVKHHKAIYATGFGPGRFLQDGFGTNQRAAIRQAGPGHLIAAVCGGAP